MLDVAVTVAADWPLPDGGDWEAVVTRAVEAAVSASPYADILDAEEAYEVAVRLSDDAEVHALNREWRGKDKPTNVLSFPQMEPEEIGEGSMHPGQELLLGDAVLAVQTCVREAAEKRLSVTEYAAHLVVHATFHLLGFDHEDDEAARDMENRERAAMARMGYEDPYRTDEVN